MFGVIANAIAIAIGSIIGLLLRDFISETLSKRIELILGFCTLVVGMRMAIKFENVLVLIGCVGIGGLIGWYFDLEQNIERGAKKLEFVVMKGKESRFAKGLTVSSILFCVGGMAVVGAINSGAFQNHEVLITKSILDGTISAPLASIYGIGILFSAIPVLLYQGAIALLASKAQFLNQPRIIGEISAVGGVLIFMIGINLSRISKVPVGDFLPAMLLVIVWALFQ